MLGGSTHEPLMTLAWPGAHLGPMGLEGAVRLSMRSELAAIEDEAERERKVRELTDFARAHCSALNVARHFEIDDVIDPAETRGIIARLLASVPAPEPAPASYRRVDAW
jgi:acetyl-CoA carboxylase carboxyltransferase component